MLMILPACKISQPTSAQQTHSRDPASSADNPTLPADSEGNVVRRILELLSLLPVGRTDQLNPDGQITTMILE